MSSLSFGDPAGDKPRPVESPLRTWPSAEWFRRAR